MVGLGVIGLLAAGAEAVEFSTAAEVWSQIIVGQGGNDGMDVAWGVGIDSLGNVVASGTLDGAANQASAGEVISWDAAGVLRYEVAYETGVAGLTDSVDQIFGLAIDNLDQVTLAGRQPSSGVADGALWAHALDGDGVMVWERTFIDGVSPEQAAFGVSFAPSNSDAFVVGWSRGDLPQLSGRWSMMRLAHTTGFDVFPAVNYDSGTESFNPDQAKGGAMDAVGGFFVAGRVGVDGGSNGSPTNDSQWAARRYGNLGTLLWEDQSGLLLDDEATVVTKANDGAWIAAGYSNLGTDNASGRNDDWRVVCYETNGDGYGGPVVRWEYTFESAPGASERATAIALSGKGDVLVGGTIVDSKTGVLAWRGVELSIFNGQEESEKIWPAGTTDSIPHAIAEVDDVLVVAGSLGNATDSDFYVVYLAADTDGDGTIDSLDGCPENEDKIEEGICGCAFSDQDGDYDGFADCDEICDGDAGKTEPGVCGCGFPDDDTDADGIMGCQDACADTAPGAVANSLGCSPDQLEPPDNDTGVEAAEAPAAGCACDQAGGPSGLLPLLGLGLAIRRRARSMPQPAVRPSAHSPTNQSPKRA